MTDVNRRPSDQDNDQDRESVRPNPTQDRGVQPGKQDQDPATGGEGAAGAGGSKGFGT